MAEEMRSGVKDNAPIKVLDYLHNRLEQTLRHTHTTTNLIYLVNGGVLAFVYFAFGMLRPLWLSLLLTAFILCILAMVNFLHALLLHNQHRWFRVIDYRIQELLVISPVREYYDRSLEWEIADAENERSQTRAFLKR